MEMSNTVLGRVHSFTLKDLKSENSTRRIKGFANAATVDRSNEVVDPTAFKSSLDKYMENPIVFYNHDWDSAIGRVVAADITDRGLMVDIEIGKGYEPADKVWAQIQQGILKAFSIGFRPITMEFNSDDEILTIKDMELYEVSVVTIPMNRESLFEVTEDRLTNIKVMNEGTFVNYKSLVPTDSVKIMTVITENTPEPESVVAEETEHVAVVEEDLSFKDNGVEKAVLEAKVAELEAKIAELTTELEDYKEGIARYTDELTEVKRENRNLKVKILFQEANIPDLLRKVL